MNQEPSALKAYLFIRTNRARKKRKLNIMAISVVVDKTTAIYLLLLVAYAVASIFIAGDVLSGYDDEFLFVEEQADLRFWAILSILPIRYVNQSFRQPGVLYSSSEYQLGMLPFSKRKIWFYCVLEKWLKQTVLYTCIGLLVVLITPISGRIVMQYLLLILIMDIVMTIPQWILFQKKVFVKAGWITGILVINTIGLIVNVTEIIAIIILISMILGNVIFARTLFRSVQWGKVTEISDYNLWNMPLISKVSETKFKRQKKYSMFRNLTAIRKPFAYTETAIHDRLWQVYLGKNAELIAQLVGTLFIMLAIMLFMNKKLAFYIAVAVAINVYASVVATFFVNRFQTDILEVLPWNLKSYKKTYLKWVLIGSIPVILPILVHFFVYMTIWVPVNAVFFACTFLYLYHIKLDKAISLLEKRAASFQLDESIGFLLLLLIAGSGIYPALSLSFIAILFFYGKRLKESFE